MEKIKFNKNTRITEWHETRVLQAEPQNMHLLMTKINELVDEVNNLKNEITELKSYIITLNKTKAKKQIVCGPRF